ncbi:MAG: hypothetical protein COU09_02535 [Candidatus Harrisonbacteria bacterium CG10_big_fil_rev_8_21_14_0_10_44_23]|uniref:Uncharacterized protein n=1 Tax=Candidatus Harrisonbacteria bacterium CG10_big_fil_rev_8_21_14_0_10_44_23 TaxID=1974585 RepID=A0A2H0UPQ6_9BACT|nr:MAG: hypothetical protein COU09_02535 [Candidatus Harrisonbacteria bacterium CG10_big_fil_rev_8_21_14_0_10_44_23]
MLAKRYRLAVQSALGKKPDRVERSRCFFIKFFKASKDGQGEAAVVVGKKVAVKATKRNRIKRLVYRELRELREGFKNYDLLIMVQSSAANLDDHAIIEELKNTLK